MKRFLYHAHRSSKRIKNNENRIAMTPVGVFQLIAGHQIIIQTGAGLGSGFTVKSILDAGTSIVDSALKAWQVEMVIKVKEPIAAEYVFLEKNLYYLLICI